MRLVSKDWKAAVSQFADSIYMSTGNSTDLGSLCKTLPHVSDLNITSYTDDLDISPVSAFSRLTRLYMYDVSLDLADGSDTRQLLAVDLAWLPPSLKVLSMHHFIIDAAQPINIQCGKLTHLALTWSLNLVEEILEFLELLPDLQVITLL